MCLEMTQRSFNRMVLVNIQKDDGDSLENREAPEDTIDKVINTNALKHN